MAQCCVVHLFAAKMKPDDARQQAANARIDALLGAVRRDVQWASAATTRRAQAENGGRTGDADRVAQVCMCIIGKGGRVRGGGEGVWKGGGGWR